jgi:hypothetical protein
VITETFYIELEGIAKKWTKCYCMTLAGDFNARIGNQPITGLIYSGKEPFIKKTLKNFGWITGKS